jgi:hypothetical protein
VPLSDRQALVVARLQADRSFTSAAARVRAFVQSGAGCRATYFQQARKLRPTEVPPKLALAHTAPPVEERPPTDHLEHLRRRFGELGTG